MTKSFGVAIHFGLLTCLSVAEKIDSNAQHLVLYSCFCVASATVWLSGKCGCVFPFSIALWETNSNSFCAGRILGDFEVPLGIQSGKRKSTDRLIFDAFLIQSSISIGDFPLPRLIARDITMHIPVLSHCCVASNHLKPHEATQKTVQTHIKTV